MRLWLIPALMAVPLTAQGFHEFDPNTEVRIVLDINGMLHTVHGRAEVDWGADFLPGGVLETVYPVQTRTETGRELLIIEDGRFC
jgi:hypothetical protein